MVVLTADHIDVKGYSSSLSKRLEYVRDHLGRKISNLLPFQLEVAAEVRSGGDVENGAGKGLRRDQELSCTSPTASSLDSRFKYSPHREERIQYPIA